MTPYLRVHSESAYRPTSSRIFSFSSKMLICGTSFWKSVSFRRVRSLASMKLKAGASPSMAIKARTFPAESANSNRWTRTVSCVLSAGAGGSARIPSLTKIPIATPSSSAASGFPLFQHFMRVPSSRCAPHQIITQCSRSQIRLGERIPLLHTHPHAYKPSFFHPRSANPAFPTHTPSLMHSRNVHNRPVADRILDEERRCVVNLHCEILLCIEEVQERFVRSSFVNPKEGP